MNLRLYAGAMMLAGSAFLAAIYVVPIIGGTADPIDGFGVIFRGCGFAMFMAGLALVLNVATDKPFQGPIKGPLILCLGGLVASTGISALIFPLSEGGWDQACEIALATALLAISGLVFIIIGRPRAHRQC